jgi:hypothetical protein
MAGRAKQSTDAGASPLTSLERLAETWDEWRDGRVVYCPRERGPLALAVDAAAGAYRFVCTRCGAASPWFESGPGGLHVRAGSVPLIPGSPIADD